nr:hypothetical protein BCU58_12035 [Vibrio sp. 10N.286.48.B7]
MTAHWDRSLFFGAVTVIAALFLDQWLGEPKRFHPLVGFGWIANRVERYFISSTANLEEMSLRERGRGFIAWFITVIPSIVFSISITLYLASRSQELLFIFNALILYLTLGGRSLVEHADRVYKPLINGDVDGAKQALSMVVSRNTEYMNKAQITSSTVETVLENGNDAVVGPIFWFILLGAPGAILFRLANTLDAMWGYKNQKYQNFGYTCAKADDFLGWVPARITAMIYAAQGQFKRAIYCWFTQAQYCSSPNGGVVMTAGAGSLGVLIGGPTYYDGVLHDKRLMGSGQKAKPGSIARANALVTRGSIGLAVCWLGICGAAYFISGGAVL